MTLKYQSIAFTDDVRAAQERNGSAAAYSHDHETDRPNDVLSEAEQMFIGTCDSFYMASIGANGWPYIQHRGGPAGFLKITSPTTLLMPDYRGNRQYITLGNMAQNDRVSLFFMDYGRQARLKVFARVKEIDLSTNAELRHSLNHPNYKARIERALEFQVEAYDWNCPQHITPRYTQRDIRTATDRMAARIIELENEVERLKNG